MRLAAILGLEPGTMVRRAQGCAACGQSGHAGRIGVYEALRVDEGLRRLIHDEADEARLADHAFAHAPRLADAARALVVGGAKGGIVGAGEAARILRQEQG